jgi:predicted nuclease of predicted toxin-antitoxin system
VRFKLDENLPVELAAELRSLGHDTETVADEGLCGAPDPEVVNATFAASRILLTLDEGIGNLQAYPVPQDAEIVLFRPDASGRRAIIAFVRERLQKLIGLSLSGHLTAVGTLRIRSR